MEKCIIKSRLEKEDQCKYLIVFRKDTLYKIYNGLYIAVYLEEGEQYLYKIYSCITEVYLDNEKFYWKYNNKIYWLPTNQIQYSITKIVDELLHVIRVYGHSMCMFDDGSWMMKDYSTFEEQIKDFNKELHDTGCKLISTLELETIKK